MKISEIISVIETVAPPPYQEDYDNSGLLVGDPDDETDSVLICLDCTEKVVEEAVRKGCRMIVAHHPLIFKGLKRISSRDDSGRALIACIRNNIAVYAAHTNLDNVLRQGVNTKFAEKIGLQHLRILKPKKGVLSKLIVYSPDESLEQVRHAIFMAGGGKIGEYSECSFASRGSGTFLPSEKASPYSGSKGKRETANEWKLEALLPSYLAEKAVAAAASVHPYEEMAYEVIPLSNRHQEVGSGAIGELKEEMEAGVFLELLRTRFGTGVIRHTEFSGKIKKVALCGGAGSFLLEDARKAGAQAYVSADFKYHEFFGTWNDLMICDIGHYESEIYTSELFYEVIREKFPTFAVIFCETITNPVKYYK